MAAAQQRLRLHALALPPATGNGEVRIDSLDLAGRGLHNFVHGVGHTNWQSVRGAR